MRGHGRVEPAFDAAAFDADAVGAHDLADDQAQGNALARRFLVGLARRELLDLLHAHAAQHLHLQVAHLFVDHDPGQFERIGRMELLQQLLAQALLHGVGDLLLHGGAHLGAEFLHAALVHAKTAHECLVELRQALLLDQPHPQRKLRVLAGHALGGIVVGKARRHLLFLARLHAVQGRIELLQDRAGAQHYLELLALAARENLAVDPALEGDRDAVSRDRRALHGREHRLLPAHALQHGIDIGGRDFGNRAIHRQLVEWIELDLGQYFEHRRVAQLGAQLHLQRLDARVAGRPQFFLRDGLDETALHQVGDRLGVHLSAVLLAHHVHGHLALAEPLEARGARQVLEPLVDAGGHQLARHGHLEAPFQSIRGNYGNLHLAIYP